MRIPICVSLCLAHSFMATASFGQSSAWVDPAQVKKIHDRLLPEIEKIRIFDHHAHPGYADDPDVDAMTVPPGSEPLRIRLQNPELVAAAAALFGYPYRDLTPEHAQWLIDKKKDLKKRGPAYFNQVLDQVGISQSAANRVAMPDYLDPKRFLWVGFGDSVLFPFANRALAARNPDNQVFIPMQERKLQRELKSLGLTALPATLDGYLSFVKRLLEQDGKQGAIAIKFEAAYFRSLHFGDPSREAAAAAYEKYRSGGVPDDAEYTRFQDFVFRYLISEAGRVHLPVQFHSSVGVGDFFNLHNGNVLNLENILRDPRYDNVTFVLVHGGYPYDQEAIWLAMRKNVYLDSSLLELLLYPDEFKTILRRWLEKLPGKVMFGSDAFPYNEALGAEESYWLAVRSARSALAVALAEMVAAGEISETEALAFARNYLHDTAANLYRRAD